jgi:TonB family protein
VRRVLRAASCAACVCVAASSIPARAGDAPPVTPPEVVTRVDATYPEAALAARKEATVALQVTVGADGAVNDVTVVESAGEPFDGAAIAAARQWQFKPARRGDEPVASRIRIPFRFALPPPSPPVAAVSPPPSVVAVAPPSAPPPSPTAPAPAAIDVTVLGRRPPTQRGASDFQIPIGQLADLPHANASDFLKLAPGILLTNEGGEGHAEQVFMRGFDAREGQDIEFTVGGVPINEAGNLHGNGYADTHFIIPELIQSLRVVEGPFDPHQGNFAAAGSADYELGLPERGLSARYTTGSWGTHRYLGLWGPPGESTHTFGGAEIYETQGFGQNRSAQRGSAMAQYEGRLGATGSYRLTAQGYATHFHTAGVIREDDYQSGRIGFYDSYDLSAFAREAIPEGGDASRYSIAADVETHPGDTVLSQQVFVIKRDMRLLENFTGFLLDVQEPLQSLHAQRGDMLDLNVHELTIGARGSARWHALALGQRQELELGYFARGDSAVGTQQRLEASTGVPYLTETDLSADLGDIALYGDANLRPFRWLSLRGGARAEIVTFDVLDNCAAQSVAHPSPTNPPVDQSCLTQQDMGRPREADQVSATSGVVLLPRVSLIAGPFRNFSFSASYGQGIRSVDPSYVTQNIRAPFASITAYEAGASYAGEVRNTALAVRSVLFQTVVDRELLFDQTAGRNTLLGVGTTRTGWLGALRWTGSFFDESANLTLVRARFNNDDQAVAYIPGVVFRSDTALFRTLPWAVAGRLIRGSLDAGITYVRRRPLPDGQLSGNIFTIDAAATLRWANFEVRLVATNLLDAQYRLGEYNYASDFHSQPQPTLVPDRTFTAGPPRGVFATFGINFGGA